MKFADYLKQVWPDALLCALAACALGLNLAQCFHIPDEIAENVLVVFALTTAPLLALFGVAFSRRTLAIGVPALLVVAGAALGVLASVSPAPLFADVYENTGMVFLVLTPASLVLFLLTRTKPGIVVAFAAGGVLCGAVQFLYLKNLIVPTAVYLIACAALYLVKSGAGASARSGIMRLQLARLGTGAGLCAVAAALSLAVFFLAIAPLNPPVHELKLITEYYSLEEVHVTSLVDWLHLTDPDLASQTTDDRTRQTNATDERQQQAQGQDASQSEDDSDLLAGGSMLPDVVGTATDIVRYFQEHPWMAVLILVAFALAWACVVAIRRALRARRAARWGRLAPESEVQELYRYACAGMECAAVFSRNAHTPLSLAQSAGDQVGRFENRGETMSFAEFSDAFSRVGYGGATPTVDELAAMRAYAANIPGRVMRYVGCLKYLRLFFRV